MQWDLTCWSKDQKTGDKYMFLAIDHFTKYAWGMPIERKTAECVREALQEMWTTLPVPAVALMDNGGEWKGVVLDLIAHHKIERRLTQPYHSNTNGGRQRASQQNIVAKGTFGNFNAACGSIY